MQGVGGSSPLSPTIVVKRFLHFAEAVFLWILIKLHQKLHLERGVKKVTPQKDIPITKNDRDIGQRLCIKSSIFSDVLFSVV